EPASLLRDDRQGEAFPTVYSLDAGQDRENNAKTSAMPYESSPRVPFLDADEGRGIIDIGEELRADKSTELGSNDTREMVNVLSSMEAANIFSSGSVAASVSPADVFPTAGVSTVSGSFPTISAIFTTASVVTPYTRRSRGITTGSPQHMRIPIISAKDKGKEKVIETEVPKKKKLQEQIDAQKDYWKIIRLGGHTEAYQFFVDMLKQFDREDLHQLWILVKETFSIKQPTSDKEKELWVELKRLFEPDSEDQLWTYNQAFLHDPLDRKLYDICGVHHVSTKNQEYSC
nr:hypothetical protein [Tanacetum cinerariifolium]